MSQQACSASARPAWHTPTSSRRRWRQPTSGPAQQALPGWTRSAAAATPCSRERTGTVGNYKPTTAPVSFPALWDTPYFDWVLYNNSVRQLWRAAWSRRSASALRWIYRR